MDVRARILNYTIFGPAKFHYIRKNKFLKIENNFQKLKKNSRAITLNRIFCQGKPSLLATPMLPSPSLETRVIFV